MVKLHCDSSMETTIDEYWHFTNTDPLSVPDSYFAELCTILSDHENDGNSVALDMMKRTSVLPERLLVVKPNSALVGNSRSMLIS